MHVMASTSRKRKQRIPEPRSSASSERWNTAEADSEDREPDPALFIQAHEADIIRGPQASIAASSLEVFKYNYNADSSSMDPVPKVGNALIQWGGTEIGAARPDFPGDEDDERIPMSRNESDAIWVDRYDARLLLDTLPVVSSTTVLSAPASPGGWSDLPSDSEDTFFFSPEEAEDIRKEKRRRVMEQNREARVKARMAEDGEEETQEEEWGGSDEEPEDVQKELMRRTAAQFLASSNPAQLEMRILANHGSDKRFAFLRGRWYRAWQIIKGKARLEKEAKEREKQKKNAGPSLGLLAGYGDSDNDDDDDSGDAADGDEGADIQSSGAVKDEKESLDNGEKAKDDAAAKEARRLRAKEWAEKRRAKKDVVK